MRKLLLMVLVLGSVPVMAQSAFDGTWRVDPSSAQFKGGDKFQIAIFGVNGPISVAPANSIWFREAKLQFYK